jgi:hypothetical protein
LDNAASVDTMFELREQIIDLHTKQLQLQQPHKLAGNRKNHTSDAHKLPIVMS